MEKLIMNEKQIKQLYYVANYVCKRKDIVDDEDLIQDLVFDAYKKLEKYYDKSKGGNKRNFIQLIMSQKLKQILERKKHIETTSLENIIFEYNINMEEYYKQEIIEKIIDLVELPMRLNVMEGYSLSEVATMLNRNIFSIRNDIDRNILRIRRYCQKRRIGYE